MSKEIVTYGWELILDLHGCDARLFNRKDIENFFIGLCKNIKMQKCEVYFWDDVDVPEEERQTLPHTKVTSAVCFILTSKVVVHTLDLLETVYVNVFSCKDFDKVDAAAFAASFFCGKVSRSTVIERTARGQRNVEENED